MRNPFLPVLLQSRPISKDIHTFILSKIPNVLQLPPEVTLTTCLRDIKHLRAFGHFPLLFRKEGPSFSC